MLDIQYFRWFRERDSEICQDSLCSVCYEQQQNGCHRNELQLERFLMEWQRIYLNKVIIFGSHYDLVVALFEL